MATRMKSYKIIAEDNLKKYLKNEKDIENTNTSISNNIKKWLDKTEEILKQIWFILHQDNYIKKEELLKDFHTKYKVDIELIEYLVSGAEKEIIDNQDSRLLRHNYYTIKNQILEIKNIILSEKIDKHEENLTTADDKLSNLENKFEGLGATVITIILSITIISAAVTGISNMPPAYIPLFVFSMVWLGMTFLIFTNNLFNKNDFNSKQATIMYLIISIMFVVILFVTVHLTLPN